MSMASQASAVQDNLGPWLVFSHLNAILYGILCLQCYLFFQGSSTQAQKPLVKYSISVLFLLNTLHMALSLHDSYWLMVLNFGNFDEIVLRNNWSSSAVFLVSAVSNYIVQLWFTWRIWRLSELNVYLTGFLASLITVSFGFGIALSAKLLPLKDNAGLASFSWLLYTFNGLDIAANLAITVVLCIYLTRHRSTPVRRTKSLVNTLIVYTLNTGLLGLCITTCSLILRITKPDSLVFAADFIPYSELYTNALLASLNARDWLWFKTDEPMILSIPLDNLTASSGRHTDAGRAGERAGSINNFKASTRSEDDLAVRVQKDGVKAAL